MKTLSFACLLIWSFWFYPNALQATEQESLADLHKAELMEFLKKAVGYPAHLKSTDESGQVEIRFSIDQSGQLELLNVFSIHPLLASAVEQQLAEKTLPDHLYTIPGTYRLIFDFQLK